MSITGFSSHHNNNNTKKSHKKSTHWRNNSGELDVFAAAKHFSSSHDPIPCPTFSDSRQNIPARLSLDMPTMRNPIIPLEFHYAADKKQPKFENKKYKQPSSPGGRLASFLNSFFKQTSSKKKKSKPGKDLDDENTPGGGGGRKKGRSSISHFRIITNSSNSVAGDDYIKNSNLNKSGYVNTPTKSYNGTTILPGKSGDFKATLEDEKSRVSEENDVKKLSFEFLNWKSSEEREIRKFSDVDDYPDSDSSSDLFDLPNHELNFYSSGLPVYETTHMNRSRLSRQFAGQPLCNN